MFPSVAGGLPAKNPIDARQQGHRRRGKATCPPSGHQRSGASGRPSPPEIEKTPLKTPASPYTKPHNWRVGGEVTQRIANP